MLGSAAGGGFPQWNCRCPVCILAWNQDLSVFYRALEEDCRVLEQAYGWQRRD